jgi:hypothetical protein
MIRSMISGRPLEYLIYIIYESMRFLFVPLDPPGQVLTPVLNLTDMISGDLTV